MGNMLLNIQLYNMTVTEINYVIIHSKVRECSLVFYVYKHKQL